MHGEIKHALTFCDSTTGANNSIQTAGVQYILDSVIEALVKNPERRYLCKRFSSFLFYCQLFSFQATHSAGPSSKCFCADGLFLVLLFHLLVLLSPGSSTWRLRSSKDGGTNKMMESKRSCVSSSAPGAWNSSMEAGA